MFMGAMMLIVLPLFLIVSARMISDTEFGNSSAGKASEILLYAFSAFCLFGLLVLVVEVISG
jgi:hypothetical protein